MPKSEFAKRDFYDVWLPILAPSQELVSFALASHDERSWKIFVRKYRAEMKQPDAAHTLDLLAALSHQTNISVGCYCEDEGRCHRSVLRELLEERRGEDRLIRASRQRVPVDVRIGPLIRSWTFMIGDRRHASASKLQRCAGA